MFHALIMMSLGAFRLCSLGDRQRLVPNDNQAGERAPAYRVFAGKSELGAAWKARSQGDNPRDHLSLKLDDPCLSEAMSLALFEAERGEKATLVWNGHLGS
jgi:uncharacterized protein (DUF736 family)